MIKVDINDEHTQVEVEGSLITIASDVCSIIHNIHSSLFKKDMISAMMFRTMITKAVEKPESGLFRYDYDKGEE